MGCYDCYLVGPCCGMVASSFHLIMEGCACLIFVVFVKIMGEMCPCFGLSYLGRSLAMADEALITFFFNDHRVILCNVFGCCKWMAGITFSYLWPKMSCDNLPLSPCNIQEFVSVNSCTYYVNPDLLFHLWLVQLDHIFLWRHPYFSQKVWCLPATPFGLFSWFECSSLSHVVDFIIVVLLTVNPTCSNLHSLGSSVTHLFIELP